MNWYGFFRPSAKVASIFAMVVVLLAVGYRSLGQQKRPRAGRPGPGRPEVLQRPLAITSCSPRRRQRRGMAGRRARWRAAFGASSAAMPLALSRRPLSAHGRGWVHIVRFVLWRNGGHRAHGRVEQVDHAREGILRKKPETRRVVDARAVADGHGQHLDVPPRGGCRAPAGRTPSRNTKA